MWSGGGKPYSFRNQPIAGGKNFESLAMALLPLLDPARQAEVLHVIIPHHSVIAQDAVNEVFRQKLGLLVWSAKSEAIFERLDDVMEKSAADYTLFYRQLTTLPEMCITSTTTGGEEINNDDDITSFQWRCNDDYELLEPFLSMGVFYEQLSDEMSEALRAVLTDWLQHILTELNSNSNTDCHINSNSNNNSDSNSNSDTMEEVHSPPPPPCHTPALISSRMRTISPKYIPREWMLEKAYSAAYQKDFSELHRLQVLFESPYTEQPQFEADYYRRTPENSIGQGGISTMT